ncbi:hypothetical protein [Alcanivorax quisquiliarum]|uniref:Ribbon-helix-helix protein CopG domain-containing protein n=1 Tax=Alcanivorax quisquiliarum TaxID=2933565 RepID=A0ABT0E9X9_9GAMM|nr:hypothetical protein [Alcanivorax quisquiliarum]MCK0538594.1 hypothetical protein [Alcanivorax quisquiliarum]
MTDNTRPPRRGRRPAPDNERKDRVIQTRVPRDLEDTLRNAAERQRVSVSHLIRHVLEDTFQLVDNIVADSASLMGNVSRDARRLAATARGQAAATPVPRQEQSGDAASAQLETVDAWQAVIINRPGHCLQCGTALARGQHAYRGLSAQPGAAPAWLCEQCLQEL